MTKTETAKSLLRRVFIKMNSAEYYTIDGKCDGEYKCWWRNGQLFIHCFYENGKREGEYKAWYVSGQLSDHCHYKNDKLDGEYKSWYDNGQLIAHCHYKNGVKVK